MASRADYPDERECNRVVIEEFRANEGRVSGDWEGKAVLILTTTGRKSGRLHETPTGYTRDGENYVLPAAHKGAPNHPDWYFNLIANPVVRVEVGTESFQARATPAEGAEYERILETRTTTNPNDVIFQAKTARLIPLVVLERIS